jgi:hypothetical protein
MPKRLNKDQRSVLLNMILAVNSSVVIQSDSTGCTTIHCCGKINSIKKLLDQACPDKRYHFLLDWTIYSVNMPGYRMETPDRLFLTDRGARGYYCRELELRKSNYTVAVTLREILS